MERRRILLAAALMALALVGSACASGDATVPAGPAGDVGADQAAPREDATPDLFTDQTAQDAVPTPQDTLDPPDELQSDLLQICGDVNTDDGEDCDDGKNGNPLDGCRDDCSFTCSDPEEDCEDVVGDCGVPLCEAGGVGQLCVIQAADDPPPGDGNPCTDVVCDQGVPSIEALPDGVPCDNGAGLDGDYCVAAVCAEPVCGDEVVGPLEDCDDGNDVDGDGCTTLCVDEDLPPCPLDMLLIPASPQQGVPEAFCMDRYEASRPDATATSMGVSVAAAMSQPGVLPWWEPDVSGAEVQVFAQACEASNKRLCEADEWSWSCGGVAGNTYVFGMAFDEEVCNSVDTWCSDWCLQHGVEPVLDGDGCGFSLYETYPQDGPSYKVVPTGYMTMCMNEHGVHDLGGNVWEVVLDDPEESPRGWPFQLRGGAFDSGTPSLRLQCGFEANWTTLPAGFRCCKDLD
jgi:cysteine-rich repeat protein